jgi:hypothetical protein
MILFFFFIRGTSMMFGAAVYGFEAIGIILPSYTAMKHKSRFNFLMIFTQSWTILNYCLFGGFSYLAFGKQTQSLVTCNLDDFATAHGGIWKALTLIITIW